MNDPVPLTGMSDPTAQLASRIGELKYKLAMMGGAGQFIGGLDSNSAARGITAQLEPLESLLRQYQDRLKPQQQSGFSNSGSSSRAGGERMPSYMQQEDQEYNDPYRKVRRAGIPAAIDYLEMDDPHLLSNLFSTSRKNGR